MGFPIICRWLDWPAPGKSPALRALKGNWSWLQECEGMSGTSEGLGKWEKLPAVWFHATCLELGPAWTRWWPSTGVMSPLAFQRELYLSSAATSLQSQGTLGGGRQGEVPGIEGRTDTLRPRRRTSTHQQPPGTSGPPGSPWGRPRGAVPGGEWAPLLRRGVGAGGGARGSPGRSPPLGAVPWPVRGGRWAVTRYLGGGRGASLRCREPR